MLELYPINHWAQQAPFVSAPHAHTHYEVFYFEQGHGTHCIDFDEYPITDHSVFLISRQQVHYITAPLGARNVGWVLSFGLPFFERLDPALTPLFGSFVQAPAYSLAGTGRELNAEWFTRLARELATPRPQAGYVLAALTNVLLAYLNDQPAAVGAALGSPDSYQRLYHAFAEALEAHLARLHTVAGYAALLGLPPKQLNRLCQRIRGQSALATIHERLNLEARRHLFRSGQSVKEIGYSLGFADPAYFSAFFKRLNGQSPEAFRTAVAQIHQR
ncbi:helix-turn-helix domain-containing protein [Hymenobacter terrenus]|uniref:helix-turn-helix domain-containing protein n=1 Tax=Hymenobacter terrenus TaxID=1629124 RepID=UPI000695CD35|nr:helix-turn-helix domain-containing protein [Hymenobacter terrenus]